MGWRKIWALSRHATLGSVCRNIKYARNNPIHSVHTTVYIHHKQATASHKNTQTQSTHALNSTHTRNTHNKVWMYSSHTKHPSQTALLQLTFGFQHVKYECLQWTGNLHTRTKHAHTGTHSTDCTKCSHKYNSTQFRMHITCTNYIHNAAMHIRSAQCTFKQRQKIKDAQNMNTIRKQCTQHVGTEHAKNAHNMHTMHSTCTHSTHTPAQSKGCI